MDNFESMKGSNSMDKNDGKLIVTPKFYTEFACIAGKCPDTCCKDWDIVVDDETIDFYRSTGDNDLISRLKTDDDGDTVIQFDNGVCPFLNGNKLCGIQLKYGGERICKTCREFPRITQDYTEFEERMLTFACPESARMMMSDKSAFDFITDIKICRDDNGYDKEYMNFLLRARFMTAEIFRSNAPFAKKMRRALAFTENAQALIDDEIFKIEYLSDYATYPYPAEEPDRSFIFERCKTLDVMDSHWLKTLCECSKEKIPTGLDEDWTCIALYYIARYYLTAISTYDIITTVKRIYCAWILCGAMVSHEHAESDAQARALIYQKYSKEIEHSDENLEYFTDLFLEESFNSERLV